MSHLRKTIILTLLLLQSAVAAYSQKVMATHSHYSTDNGLASNTISKMVQDDYGFLWLATWNGLSRFDGYHFYNYRMGPGSGIPYLHNRISALTVDTQQNIWMRMYDNRVFVLHRATDRIIFPFEGISGSNEYRTFHALFVTTGGDVLVSIDGVGLYRMHVDGDKVRSQLITTGSLEVTSMAEGYQGDIWLGTNKGIHRLDAGNLTVERKGFFTDELVTSLFSNGYNIFAATESGKILSFSYGQEPKELRKGGLPIHSVFADSHGLVWFADTRLGCSWLNPETGEEKLMVQQVTSPDYDGYGGEFNEVDGTLWVSFNHGGYGYYNREADRVEYFHNNPSNPWDLSNTVMARLELPEGVVWESTNLGGLEKLEIQKKTIARTMLVAEPQSHLDNEIRAILYDTRHKTLIMGNKSSTLFIFDQATDKPATTITHDDQGKPLGRIYGLMLATDGSLWVTSKDNGLYHATPTASGFSLHNLCHSDDDPTSLSSNSAYVTVEDTKGNLWVATYGGGVNVMPKGATGFIHSKNDIRTYPYKSHQKVRTMALDKDGTVWAGTSDGILLMSMDDNGKVTVEPLKPSESEPESILLSNDIVCLARDSKGTMWIGTNGGGLARTIGKDSDGRWLFEHFGARDGLPSEEIRSITFDSHGNVWFATEHNLCSFDTVKRIFTSYSSLDGVDATQCSEGAAVTLPDGTILFGTINGYYTVDHSKLVNSVGNMLKLRITDFWLNDVQQSPRLTNDFDYYVPEAHEVTLPSHNSIFAIRFASLNYQLQHRVHYQYMIEGHDSDWRNVDRDRTVTISNLPTGTYRFKVRAFLLESPDKADMRAITIIVPPYFLLSKDAIWLYMAIVAAIALTILFGYQSHLARKYGVIAHEKPRPTEEAPTEEHEETDEYEVIE